MADYKFEYVYMDINIVCDMNYYKLNAWLEETGEIICPTLEIYDKSDTDKIVSFWDNDEYLINILYPIVEEWELNKSVSNANEFNSIIEEIPLEDFSAIYSILKKGIDKGFFKQTKLTYEEEEKQKEGTREL